jgi:hypothetical protein
MIRRPVRRQELNYDPEYHRTRKAIVHFLLANGPGRKKAALLKANEALGARCSHMEHQTDHCSPTMVWRGENGAPSLVDEQAKA